MSQIDLFGEHARDPLQRRAGMGSHQATSSITDEWITPREIIAALGPFELDPCSPGDRRPWDTARRHLSAEDDGLSQPWSGRVWLNPPYSEVGLWLRRLAEHGTGTALIFARTETSAWFEHVWPRAAAVLFIRACGKRAYPSYEKAVHAALLASRKCGRPLRIYRCPDCRTFHLTKLTHWEDR